MASNNQIIPQLLADKILSEEIAPSSFLLYCVTWNLAGFIPSLNDLSYLLPTIYDIYIIATQECAQSISASFIPLRSSININKWSKLLQKYFDSTCGKNCFQMIANESLSAINMMIFVRHKILSTHITNIESESIPTGIGGILGNKGAVAVSFVYNYTYSFLFINAHFHAHQDNTIVRHKDYETINKNITLGLHPDKTKKATSRFDYVIWSGDLNYRINGNREIMDALLKQKAFNIMLQNDQLNIAKNYKQIFEDGFIENKIQFPPTYKYDINSNNYDSSLKARIPSWTDRILYKSNKIKSIISIEYNANNKLKISDHRPVFALFKINLKKIQIDNLIDIYQYTNYYNENKIGSKSMVKAHRICKKFFKYYQFMCFYICCFNKKSNKWKRKFHIKSRIAINDKID